MSRQKGCTPQQLLQRPNRSFVLKSRPVLYTFETNSDESELEDEIVAPNLEELTGHLALRFSTQPDMLGNGRYSVVVPAEDAETNKRVAIKSMSRTEVTDDDFEREVRVLKKLADIPDSNFARFAEFVECFTLPTTHNIVFKPYGGTLGDILRNSILSPIASFQGMEIALQLIQAVKFLHDNGIIHTDLKPDNVMLINVDSREQKMYVEDGSFHIKASSRDILVETVNGSFAQSILQCTEIRLIDFGSVGEQVTENRGLVGWKWTEYIDHFALGCIIAEIAMSKPLLHVEAKTLTAELIAIESVLGPFSESMKHKMERDSPHIFQDVTNADFAIPFIGHLKTLVKDKSLYTSISQLTELDDNFRTSLTFVAKRTCFQMQSL
ncbi:kinase-like domain-containing protein [Mycena sp. CBHHK59/15]|nr:kinase-like domain-containing protein [Mycena sp. CBHHK59/15]